MAPVRVLLVDDHEMLTDALTARLSSTPDMWVVGRCTTEDPSSAGLATLLRPDIITIEITMARDTAALLGRFRSAWPAGHIVVLTESHSEAQAVEAARAGVDGWVSKESSVETLARVLRWACRGHASFPPEQLGPILRELRADVERVQLRDGPLDVLTKRERGVLMGMVRGLSTVQLADELGVTTNTVRTHTTKILSKLNVHSRLEAASVARLAGMEPGGAPTT
ncbi:MAG: LuxR C-terminal-related transcriptional regulator [Pseudonocardiaceae bacterium]